MLVKHIKEIIPFLAVAGMVGMSVGAAMPRRIEIKPSMRTFFAVTPALPCVCLFLCGGTVDLFPALLERLTTTSVCGYASFFAGAKCSQYFINKFDESNKVSTSTQTDSDDDANDNSSDYEHCTPTT